MEKLYLYRIMKRHNCRKTTKHTASVPLMFLVKKIDFYELYNVYCTVWDGECSCCVYTLLFLAMTLNYSVLQCRNTTPNALYVMEYDMEKYGGCAMLKLRVCSCARHVICVVLWMAQHECHRQKRAMWSSDVNDDRRYRTAKQHLSAAGRCFIWHIQPGQQQKPVCTIWHWPS